MAKEQEKSKTSEINERSIIETLPKGFEILVNSLDNVIGRTLPFNVSVKIEYIADFLIESPPITISNEQCNPVEFKTVYKINSERVTSRHLDDITAHPILFTVLYKSEENEVSVKSKKSLKESKQSGTGTKASKKSTENSSNKSILEKSQETKMLGAANFDILPLLFGEPILKEVLLLEDPSKKTGSQTTAWTNLPKLNVQVSPLEGTLEDIRPWNIVFFTLESLYNITPNFAKTPGCEVVTRLSLFQNAEENLGTVRFTDGQVSSCPLEDSENMKRWFSLGAVTGRTALSKYRRNTDLIQLKNTLNLTYSKLNETLNSSKERLEWNLLRRHWLEASAQEEFFQKLVKYRCWPLEFRLENKNVEIEKKKPKSREEAIVGKSENRFVAFLDLSNLLYPGVSRTQLTSQLHTYVAKDVINKWGEEMFPPCSTPLESPLISKGTKQTTGKSEKQSAKSKTDKSAKVKEKPKKRISAKEQEVVIEEEEVAVPLSTEEGDPIFVIVEVELMHPLVKKKTKEEILASVMKIVPQRPSPEPTVVSAQSAQRNYEDCIEALAKFINEEYQNFHSFEDLEEDENDIRFIRHLHLTGAYSKMSSTMDRVIEDYVKDKIGRPCTEASQEVLQSYVSEVYVKLVEEMNRIVNLVIVGQEVKQKVLCNAGDLYCFAVEAVEQGRLQKADEYFLKRLAHFKRVVPQHWLDYAIFQLSQGDLEKAAECGYEVLSLNIRHKEGLLFYALLAWYREDFETARLFFNAVTELYPRYYQAWFCFYLFYTQTENKEGSDVTYMNGMKCIEDPEDKSGHKFCLLSWCSGFEDVNSPFVSTAILLLKLGFPEFAETCLARELLLQGAPTVPFLYYLAVSHYKQQRYNDSLSHLEQALHIEWQDVRLWTLKGHNLYKLKLETDAQESYQFVLDSEGIPQDLHLLHLRMGQILLDQGDYQTAMEVLMKPCTHSPTPLAWLGLGMASYMLEKYEDADLALNESNMLDPTIPDVWALLALVNMKRSRFNVAIQCENEAKRQGLLPNSPLGQEVIALKEIISPCCP